MNNKQWRGQARPGRQFELSLSLILAVGFAAASGQASAPEWLRAAARSTVPSHSEDTEAVCLLSEQVTSVRNPTDIETTYRRAYKILRPGGRRRGTVVVYFDGETKLGSLKSWSLQPNGTEYEVKEKEAVEASIPGAGVLYADTRYKVLSIPAAEPESVVGYEYVQRRRPYILEDGWAFQYDVPVASTRYEIRLPNGWEYKPFWANHAAVAAQPTGENGFAWEFHDVAPVEAEPEMPAWRALAGHMAVSFFPPSGSGGATQGSWKDVGAWYGQLIEGRRQLTPAIKQKVIELTMGAKTPMEKAHLVARFVQHDIRYVGLEIGIGGYQPHAAAEVFTNRYGDCKDKVTLLSAMLEALGIDSYYLAVHSDRGVVVPEVPTALAFDHVIIAMRIPPGETREGLNAVLDGQPEGKLLPFDPTDDLIPFGSLPSSLQGGWGLLVTKGGGRLVELPLMVPPLNRLLRSGKVDLSEGGAIAGFAQELSWGAPAARRRAGIKDTPQQERRKIIENLLGRNVGSLVLEAYKLQGLENPEEPLVLQYNFSAQDYAQRAGDLLLLRLCFVGERILDLSPKKDKPRKSPVEFPSATLNSEMFDISLPKGYQVDELPPPTDIKSTFGEYRSKVELEGAQLHYVRTLEIRQVRVPVPQVDELRKFYLQIAGDQRNVAILKRSPVPEPKPAATTPSVPSQPQ